jgi:CheY-like chemotaxis protein
MQQIALVVDDSRVARMTLSKLLVAHDLKVVELGSGEDALIYLKGDNVKPDIIFMDVMMGGMDGLTAMQQIKADDNLKYIPVVVCTGHDTDADRVKSQQAGAVATLTKPPKAEALDGIIAELAQHIAIVPQADNSSSAIDSKELLEELKALVKQDLLPTVQQELRELAETVSRQVANDTAEHQIAEQLALLSKNQQQPELDEKRLVANVINTIEQDLLPKMHKDVREMAEDISRQIAADTAEQMVAQQVKLSVDDMLPALKEQLLAQTQRVTEDLANSVAKHATHDAVANSAEKAVQNATKESDLPRQIMVMLNTEGKAWLQRHEQQMFEPLIKQVEAKLTPMVMTYLNDHLTQMIAPIARTVVEESLAVTKTQADTVTNTSNDNHGLEGLSQQVSRLKMMVMGLACMVLALAVVIIL